MTSTDSPTYYFQMPTGARFCLSSYPVISPTTMASRNIPSVLRRRQRHQISTSNAQEMVNTMTLDLNKSDDLSDQSAVLVEQVIVTNNGEAADESFTRSMVNTTIDSSPSSSYENALVITEADSISTPTAPYKDGSSVSTRANNTSSDLSLQEVEFSFLDNKNVCCGLCGEIVLYEHLMSDHLPNSHPEVFIVADTESAGAATSATSTTATTTMEFERQQMHLKDKLSREQRLIETGFKMTAYRSAARAPRLHSSKRGRGSGDEPSRRVSAIRVNPRQMPLAELEEALRKKMYEKLHRRVSVTLMDRMHARCGICNAIISLNKKFEIVHLVRHFNCWHPTVHTCAGEWSKRQSKRRGAKPLSIHDFAVVDTGSGSPDSLQCIWCGMFVESHGLAQHFGELHAEEVEVPKCNLCMQELIVTARFQEKFGIDIQITLPDEHHMQCSMCGVGFSSELCLEAHIQRRHVDGIPAADDPQQDEDDVNLEEIGPEAFSNSRMVLGKRRRPKRQFIMPALRQAVPLDSLYVEPIAECHWKCKLCEGDIYGAVISAAAIRHYKYRHPDDVDKMQYEIGKSRLEKISDGCMEFVHPQLIECLLCQQSFNLHQPFNMCRAIRHLKAKHPNLMPEYAGLTHVDELEVPDEEQSANAADAVLRRDCGVGTATTTTTMAASADNTTLNPPMIYDHRRHDDHHVLHSADLSHVVVSEGMVYNSKTGEPAADIEDEDEAEAEEIIMAAGPGDTLTFDAETNSIYAQQFVMVDGGGGTAAGAASTLSTPVPPYSTSRSDLVGNMMTTMNEGIRVFRTPQRYRYYDHGGHQNSNNNVMMSNAAAKNAHLDHGAIVRQLPPPLPHHHNNHHQISSMHQQAMQPTNHNDFLDRMVDSQTPIVFQNQSAPPPPAPSRQYYLLLQTSTDDVLASTNTLLDSPMMGGGSFSHDRSIDRRSVISVIDDPIIEAQRLTELMAQAHSAMVPSTVEDRQPQAIMAGDDPF